jgi:hypothetical protein
MASCSSSSRSSSCSTSGARRATVSRLRPPTLVPLADVETATAVGLLGGAIEDYLGQADPGATA